MHKTKQQKQEEAIQRLRSDIPRHREWLMRCQAGGDIYQAELRDCGLDNANTLARKELKKFQAKCKTAKIDTHGNPI